MSVFLLTWWIISDFQNWGSSLAFWDIRWPIVNSGFYFICAGRASIASANHRCLKKVLNSNSKRVLLVRKNRVQINLWKIVFILPFINSYLSLQFKYMIFHTFICILHPRHTSVFNFLQIFIQILGSPKAVASGKNHYLMVLGKHWIKCLIAIW